MLKGTEPPNEHDDDELDDPVEDDLPETIITTLFTTLLHHVVPVKEDGENKNGKSVGNKSRELTNRFFAQKGRDMGSLLHNLLWGCNTSSKKKSHHTHSHISLNLLL